MTAILGGQPALSRGWLSWVILLCELWRIRTGPVLICKCIIGYNLSLRPPYKNDRLKITDTQFSVPSIRGFKCAECVLGNAATWEMRIADTRGRPKASIQPAKSDHIRQIERKTPFRSPSFSFAETSNERSWRLQALLGMVVAKYAPAYMWELSIANVDGSRRDMRTTPYWNALNQTWQMRPLEK